MKKIILFILIIISFQDIRAQLEKNRIYEGKSIFQWTSDDESLTVSDELADDIIRKKYKPDYLVSTLLLKKNGSFLFYYNDKSVKLGCSFLPQRRSSGSYQIKNDTIILNSKLRMDETYSINFEECETKKYNKKLLILNSDINYGTLEIETDTEEYFTLKNGDSIWISNKIKSITVSTSCYPKRFLIPLESSFKENKISINLIFNGTQNISIQNIRFILKRKKLIMLDSFYFMNIENNLFKKKRFKRNAR